MQHPWEKELAELISERFGFRLEEYGRNVLPLIEGRLKERGERREDWLTRLRRAGPSDPELRWLVEAFTIGETTFGRDPEQLTGVQQVMVERSRAVNRPIHVWSAACATGEEAFTLAILMREAGVSGTVLGTDLNEGSLQVARAAGPYSSYRLMPVPTAWRGRWFRPVGAGFTVVPELRSLTRFSRHNLVEPGPSVEGGWDLIVCRNVLIYFAPETVDAVVGRLISALHPDGALFLGAGDPVGALRQPLSKRRVGVRTVYGRPAAAAPPRVIAPPTHAGDGLVERGALRLSQHDFAGAIVDLEAALARAPDWADAHYLLGVARLKQRALAPAAAALEAALRCDRRHWPAMTLLAGVRQEQRQLLHAELHYRKALELMTGPGPLKVAVRAAALVSSAHSNLSESRELARAELDSLQRAQLRPHTPGGTL